MAAELPIRNGDASVKLRKPVGVALLDLVTLGFYGLFWYFYVNRELAALGRARGTDELGDSPVTSLLALIPGGLVIVPAVISMFNTGKRGAAAQRLAGQARPSVSPGLTLVLLLLLPPAGVWYFQAELNKVWETEAEGALHPGPQP